MLSYISCITVILNIDVGSPVQFILNKNQSDKLMSYCFLIFGKLEYTKPFEVKLIVSVACKWF